MPGYGFVLVAVAGLAWVPILTGDRTAATLVSLACYLLAAWVICRPLIEATAAGVKIRSPWRTRTYGWEAVQGFARDATGAQLVALTTDGQSAPIAATFTRCLTKQGRVRALDRWVAGLEAARPRGGATQS